MIKLIASDIDGTLLHGSETVIPAETLGEFRRLLDRGYLLAAASGRQYGCLRRLFGEVGQEMYILSENGALVFGPHSDTPLRKILLPQPEALALCHEIIARPDSEVMISGENTSYLCPKGPVVVPHVRDFVGHNVAVVSAPEAIPEPIIKVSAFCPDGVAVAAAALTERWSACMRVAVAGEAWLDFTPADKGDGIRQLADVLGLKLSEIMAFGDNFNDEAMLDCVGAPYIMDNAVPELRGRYKNHCASVAEVLKTIQ